MEVWSEPCSGPHALLQCNLQYFPLNCRNALVSPLSGKVKEEPLVPAIGKATEVSGQVICSPGVAFCAFRTEPKSRRQVGEKQF